MLKKTGILVGERDLSLERPSLRKESYAKRVADQRRRETRSLHDDHRAKYANSDDVLSASPSDEEDRFRRRRVRFVDEVSYYQTIFM